MNLGMQTTLLLALLASTPAGLANSWDLEVGSEARWFPQASEARTLQGSYTARLTTHNKLAGSWQLRSEWFGRLDPTDRHRNQLDVKQLWLDGNWRGLEVGAGITQEFWGVTESHHLVNALNQIDAVADIDGEDYLGQPMIKTAYHWPTMELALYVLPYFRAREFHEHGERLGPPLQITSAEYESGAGAAHTDLALRWAAHTDRFDIGIGYFTGTDREPVLGPASISGQASLVPYYRQIEQLGLDLQITYDTWLLKLEALHREGYSEAFHAWILGVERTFFQVANTNLDMGLIIEKLRDQRPADAPRSVFDNDLFVGTRLAFNNAADTNLILGVYVDDERIYRMEVEHRLTNRWKLALTASSFDAPRPHLPLYTLRSDDYVSLSITRFFGS